MMRYPTIQTVRSGVLCALVLVLVCPTAWAQKAPADTPGIDIDISGGAERVLTKMAIPETQVADASAQRTAKRVHELLERDMELAGFFTVMKPEEWFFDPSKEGVTKESINFENWKNVGAQGLIKSKVMISGGKANVDLRLHVVGEGKQAKLDFKAKPVDKADVDEVVHAFANAVVAYYTGAPGVFGQQIAFVRRNGSGLKQIYVMEVTGSKRAPVTKNSSINLLPSWHGGSLYYTSYLHQNSDLWVWRGGKHSKLSSQRGQNSGAAECGGKVAVTLSMGGENTDIYLIDKASGAKTQRLTSHWDIDTSPTWSPDCKRLAFVSGRAGSPQIYIMNADGSNQRRLTFKGNYNTSPAWSPNGDVIAFTSRDEFNAFDIFTVDLEGNIERLTQNQGHNEEPSFSPDGRYIVFTSSRGGRRNRRALWLMTADGQYQRAITTDTGYETPSWQK
ncbi:MAG: DPP IV N-terminal domain-containing protein [Myxococcota bacterium]